MQKLPILRSLQLRKRKSIDLYTYSLYLVQTYAFFQTIYVNYSSSNQLRTIRESRIYMCT